MAKKRAKSKSKRTTAPVTPPLAAEMNEARFQQILDQVRAQAQTQGRQDPHVAQLKEALVELEIELYGKGAAAGGWRILGGAATAHQEFSRGALRIIARLARLFYLKNPLVRRAVDVQASYVFGQGVTIHSDDEATNEEIKIFLDDGANKRSVTGGQALKGLEKLLYIQGNLFFAFFGGTTATQVRTIAFDEIDDVEPNPEDASEPWFYLRAWTDGAGVSQKRYYPDWNYAANNSAVGEYKSIKVEWTPIYHLKTGGLPDMKFGVPESYPQHDWCEAYNDFLEDRLSVSRSLSIFSGQMQAQTGAKGVSSARANMAAQINELPAGSQFIGGEGYKYSPVSVQGATINPDEGRRFMLMVCAAAGLPETFYGDVSVGTLATATSMDRPTEFKFTDRRDIWEMALITIVVIALSLSGRADADVTVDFPPILEHAIQERASAISSLAPFLPDPKLRARLSLDALGENKVDELIENMTFPEPGEADPTTPNDPAKKPQPKPGDVE